MKHKTRGAVVRTGRVVVSTDDLEQCQAPKTIVRTYMCVLNMLDQITQTWECDSAAIPFTDVN